MTTFSRLAAIFVGMANLAVLAWLSDNSHIRRGDVAWWIETLPAMLIVVIAGLVTSEIVLRRSKPLREKFSDRYGVMLFAVGLGGMLMGGLLAGLFALNGVLCPGLSTIPERILVALLSGLVDAAFGLELGLAEGLILAFPLAAILGLLRNGDRS